MFEQCPVAGFGTVKFSGNADPYYPFRAGLRNGVIVLPHEIITSWRLPCLRKVRQGRAEGADVSRNDAPRRSRSWIRLRVGTCRTSHSAFLLPDLQVRVRLRQRRRHPHMKLYKIRNWDALYENNRSRTVKVLSWVAMPNKHDGENFSNIMAHPRGAEIFAAFVLMVEIASKCSPRGTLIRDNGTPHTVSSLSVKCRAPVSWLTVSLDYLEKNTDWLEVSEITNDAVGCQQGASRVPSSCQSGAQGGKGMEGMEGTEEGNAALPPNPSGKGFSKPTIEAVKLQCAEIALPESEGDKFYDYYQANGWRVGKNPMKLWPAALANWKRHWEEYGGQNGPRIQNPRRNTAENPRNFGMPSTAKQTSDRIVAELRERGEIK